MPEDQAFGAQAFEAERPRLVALATRVLADPAEAQDVVQQAWLRLHGAQSGTGVPAPIANLPAWLTTVTTRLCLDRLRARTPLPVEDAGADLTTEGEGSDPAAVAVLADEVGTALHLVLDRLTPRERVAFVLHDSFGFDFAAVAEVLTTTPAAARQLASRARAKVTRAPAPGGLADWEVVDAFMAAARGGDLDRLVRLLAPDADVTADAAATQVGTPRSLRGRDEVAGFFHGSAHAALAVFSGGQPAYAWFHRGAAKVVFAFDVADGRVQRISFLAAPEVLADTVRRDGPDPAPPPHLSHPRAPRRQVGQSRTHTEEEL